MTRKGNGYVKWATLIPILLVLVIACMGATDRMIGRQDQSIKDTLKTMQLDLREVRQDVKTLLKER